MDSNTIRPEHAAQLNLSIRRSLNYLFRLRERMLKTGFTPTDPLYLLVSNAYDATHHLSVELHYLSCKGGVGRPPRVPDQGAELTS
jgi:hypothetical protein